MERIFALRCGIAALLLSTAAAALAADERYMLTTQAMALAPNAGGQEAYTLRLGTNRWEAGAFVNGLRDRRRAKTRPETAAEAGAAPAAPE